MQKRLILAGYTINHYIFYEHILSLFKGYDLLIYTNFKTLKTLNEKALKKNIRFKPRAFCPVIFSKNAVIIIDEPYGISLLAYLSLQCLAGKRFYLIVHNYNKWFYPEVNYNGHPDLFEKFKRWLRKLIIKRLDHFIFVSSSVKANAQNDFPDKHFYFIPFCFSAADKNMAKLSGNITVSVPGVISLRRDYEFIIRAIGQSELIKKNIRFLFLGRPVGPYGQEMFTKLLNLKKAGFKVEVSKRFIPDTIYRKHLENTHLLLSVFNTRFITSDNYSEYYGETKETGITPLAHSYALPLVVPSAYRVPQEIEGQVVQAVQTPSELTGILEKIITEPGFLTPFRQIALENNRTFNMAGSVSQFKPLR